MTERAGRELPERYEDWITGRVRLVLSDVEVTDAKREVDRVEILERVRQVRQVEGQEDQHQRGAESRERSCQWRMPNAGCRIRRHCLESVSHK